ncbi:MAG: 16S rRNA (cytosine(1402)-N(4))-methyltransferase RsmH [Pyrinomonadaceae bacterium]|nr:16S rRNA (cytosine(1402)-N(4))-methyltransferase RsmH [Pyrinomonadaceae bacterium]
MKKKSKDQKPKAKDRIETSFLKNTDEVHTSVLLAETIEQLEPKRGGVFVDCTLGLGGHSEAILQASEKTQVVGIDQDLEAIAFAKKRLEKFGDRFQVFHANFSEIEKVLEQAKIDKVDGILADLGVSSLQLDSENRGFSFRFEAPLDMRMNPDSDDETAAELLETLSEFEIARIIYEYGEERFSRRIARRIVEKREHGESLTTTKELADLVAKVVPHSKKDRIHPATRTFQALRIAVNHELEILEDFLHSAIDKLNKDGRLAIISFHSLEDRIVKRTLQKLSGKCDCPPKFPVCICGAKKEIEVLTRKPLVPTEVEIEANPRARSAKLRVGKKII